MKICFTVFNRHREHYEFDPKVLEDGEELLSFLVSKDKHGEMFIVPVIKNKKGFRRSLDVLEKVKRHEHHQ